MVCLRRIGAPPSLPENLVGGVALPHVILDLFDTALATGKRDLKSRITRAKLKRRMNVPDSSGIEFPVIC